ncbi:MAG: hypothetical protein P8Y53_14520 [Pseudolabrys sp.]
MKVVKNFIIGLIIGLLLGLWFGVNIGKGRPIYANPFKAAEVKAQLKKTGENIMEKSGQALEKGGKALQDKIKSK